MASAVALRLARLGIEAVWSGMRPVSVAPAAPQVALGYYPRRYLFKTN